VPPRRGRLPRADDARTDRACVEAEVRAPGVIEVSAGGKLMPLRFETMGLQRLCTDIAPQPGADGLAFDVHARSGEFALRDLSLFDHVQYGGLYDLEGRPAALLEPVQRLNRDFRGEAARCD